MEALKQAAIGGVGIAIITERLNAGRQRVADFKKARDAKLAPRGEGGPRSLPRAQIHLLTHFLPKCVVDGGGIKARSPAQRRIVTWGRAPVRS